MKNEIKKSFIQSNKDRDALSEEMIKELKAKGGDNMNGEAMAKEKLGMEFADLSSRLNTKEINELIRKSKSGANMNKLLKGKGLTKPGTPESFRVLLRELRSIALDIRVKTVDDEEIDNR